MSTDPRIDSYIARQADFARPILEHLRSAVHAACPEAEETLKWSMPHFLYKGQMLAGMAAFKAHATFGFWRAKDVLGETGAEREAMGQFGRLTSVADLPPDDVLHALIRKAMALTDSGARPARAEGGAEAGAGDTAGAGNRPLRQPRGAGDVRRLPAELPPRICRMGGRGEEARDPRQAQSPRRSNGWPRAKGATGNTRNAEGFGVSTGSLTVIPAKAGTSARMRRLSSTRSRPSPG